MEGKYDIGTGVKMKHELNWPLQSFVKNFYKWDTQQVDEKKTCKKQHKGEEYTYF